MTDFNEDYSKRVGLVTVTYNSAAVIEDFMRSVMMQTHEGFVLYVVDNASADDTLQRIALWADPRIKIIHSGGNVGVAAGNNNGIRAARADGCSHVLLINNDTVFGPELIAELLRESARLHAQMLVPKITYYEPANKIWCAGGRFLRGRAWATEHFGENDLDRGQYAVAHPIEYAPTCCMLIEMAVFEIVGMMDERYFVYSDDADFCFRANKLGISFWYTPTTTLAHKVSAITGGGSSRFTLHYGTRNRVYFIRKNLPWYTRWTWLMLYELFILSRLLFKIDGFSVYQIKQKAFSEALSMPV